MRRDACGSGSSASRRLGSHSKWSLAGKEARIGTGWMDLEGGDG